MKRISIALALTALVLTAPVALFAIPPSVQEARRNAQAQDIVASVGESRLQNATAARNAAILSARGAMARDIDVIISTAQTLHRVAFEINDCSITETFFESITNSLAESRLLGTSVIYEYRAADGRYWVVMALSRSSVIAEVAAAIETAEAAVQTAQATAAPALRLSPLELGRLSAMDALMRMDEALDLHLRGNE